MTTKNFKARKTGRYEVRVHENFTHCIYDTHNKCIAFEFNIGCFEGSFTFISVEGLCRMLNRDDDLDEYDYTLLLEACLCLLKKKEHTMVDMNNTIKGMKDAASCLNFILPPPVRHANDCVTDSELYKCQYRMAKEKWSEFVSQNYESEIESVDPMTNDERFSKKGKNHHMVLVRGVWHLEVKVNRQRIVKKLSKDVETSRQLRDNLLKEMKIYE